MPCKVVHLVYDLIRGGTEGQCARVAMGLASQGLPHRVSVFHRRGFFLDAVEDACGLVYGLSIRHAARLSTLTGIRRFAHWLRQEKIDLLHAWDVDAAIFGQFAARWAGIPLITSRRDLGQIYPRWKLVMMRWADRMAIRVVANAEAVRQSIISQGGAAGKIEVIPNLLDLDEFDAQAARPFSQADRLPIGRRLVVVNRLDPEKNTSLLIEALPWVRQKIPDAVLVIAGSGREMRMLQNKAEALRVAEFVCFLGAVADVPALLKCCEIGALVPTRNEGLSNTILEYMAAGLPVLATDCGGNRELLEPGAGLVMGHEPSISEMANQWRGVLTDATAAKAMGKMGRERVQTRYTPDMVLPAFLSLYRKGRPDLFGLSARS